MAVKIEAVEFYIARYMSCWVSSDGGLETRGESVSIVRRDDGVIHRAHEMWELRMCFVLTTLISSLIVYSTSSVLPCARPLPIEHILDKNEDTTNKITVVSLRDKIIAVARYLRKPLPQNAEAEKSSIKPVKARADCKRK